ncbi:MAG TPA: sigma-54 dependent transcriptional regulator [Pseudobdellovibrionaceae bacterium]|nr:sigma-54 dependent transcriptional regulator [Pseudobdellovibrionaceae bacterium]
MASQSPFFLLIVDDDALIHESIKLVVPECWKIFSVRNPEDVNYSRFYHAAFVDMHLTGEMSKTQGPSIIKKLSQAHPQLEIVAMSGDLNRELMETCLKAGAQKFLGKPLHPEEVLLTLEKIEALWLLRNYETTSLERVKLIGKGNVTELLIKEISALRGEGNPVLIEGETGTGKEVVARLLNQQEGSRPFITVNVSSIPENLFESEMFGHVKGAFTGADQNKIGLIEAANGGDLFLDEIEALPSSMQAKLLRFLELGELRKVGAKENQFVKVRIISATNRSLEDMVSKGEFREDLLYRIKGKKITIPPLRSRIEDIPLLGQHFLESERPRKNKSFTPDGLEALQNYTWPGNIRELKRVCEQLNLVSPLPIIRKEDVMALISPSINSGSQTTQGAPDFSVGLNKLVEAYEATLIRQCLKQNADMDKACEMLKISRSNLYKKIKDYGLQEGL